MTEDVSPWRTGTEKTSDCTEALLSGMVHICVPRELIFLCSVKENLICCRVYAPEHRMILNDEQRRTWQRTTLVLGKRSGRISVQEPAIFSVSSDKFMDITIILLRRLPSKSFPVHHLFIAHPLDVM
jgi:hypothetical protein